MKNNDTYNATRLFLGAILICLCTSNLHAETSKKINPSELPISQQPAPLEVYWKERGGMILIDTVCFNYPEDSNELKGCRKLALKKFREECEKYTRLYHDSRPYYDEDYWNQKEKYCTAASDYIQ